MTAILITLWISGPAILASNQRRVESMEYCQAMANEYNQNINFRNRAIFYCVPAK